jgi:hypothetical protein
MDPHNLNSYTISTIYIESKPKTIGCLCGKISIPQDGGQKLMTYLGENGASLIGVRKASVIEEMALMHESYLQEKKNTFQILT